MLVWLRYTNRQKETVAVCDAASYREFLAFCRLRALKDGVEEVRCSRQLLRRTGFQLSDTLLRRRALHPLRLSTPPLRARPPRASLCRTLR